jgi:hypothetical protein
MPVYYHKISVLYLGVQFFGLESLLRVNEAELKYPLWLWAKRCAARGSGIWPKGAILVRRGSFGLIGLSKAEAMAMGVGSIT